MAFKNCRDKRQLYVVQSSNEILVPLYSCMLPFLAALKGVPPLPPPPRPKRNIRLSYHNKDSYANMRV